MAEAYLPQPGLCQPEHNTQLFNQAGSYGDNVCVALNLSRQQQEGYHKQSPDITGTERMDGASEDALTCAHGQR